MYIGGVKEGVTEEKLRHIFSEFGDMKEVRLFTEKGYAFISFCDHEGAQEAIRYKTGTQIEGHTIRCAWGRENNGPPDIDDPEMEAIMRELEGGDAFGNNSGGSDKVEKLDGNNNSVYMSNSPFGNSKSSPNMAESWLKMSDSVSSVTKTDPFASIWSDKN